MEDIGFGLIVALLGVFGYMAVLLTIVIVAEFLRRERTATTDDDWIERSHKRKDSSSAVYDAELTRTGLESRAKEDRKE